MTNLTVWISLLISTAAKVHTSETKPEVIIQLPRNLYPQVYNISLEINLFTRKVIGSEVVEIKCLIETKTMYIHSSDLKIESIKVFHKASILNDIDVVIDGYNEYIKIYNKNSFRSEEKYFLHVNFRKEAINYGTLEADRIGFYTFYDAQSPILLSAVTQFEPTLARKLFPCFDDPYFRSKFNINVTHPKDLVAISVSPQLNVSRVNSSYMFTSFQESVALPTYLMALSLMPNISKEFFVNETRFIIWRSHEKNELIENVTIFTVMELEKIFNMNAPTNVINFVTCPHLFDGMENYGLITVHDAEFDMTDVRIVIHELVHHWWSNIVSHSWWNDLWVNEGFTEYIAQMILEKHNAKLSEDEKPYSNNDMLFNYFYSFSLTSVSRSLTYNFTNVSATYLLQTMLMEVSTVKGAFLAKYIHYVVGDSLFICIQKYIKDNYFSTTNSDKFISYVSKCSSDYEKLINQSLHYLSLMNGMPVLTVYKVSNQKLKILLNDYNIRDPFAIKLSLSKYDGTNGKEFWLTELNQTIVYNVTEPYIVDFNRSTPCTIRYNDDKNVIDLIFQLSKIPISQNYLAYFGLLCDLGLAISVGQAPVYALFTVIENIDTNFQAYYPLVDVFDMLLNELSAFLYSDVYSDLASKTLKKVQSLSVFKKCKANLELNFEEEDLCWIASYFCTPNNTLLCNEENILAKFKNKKFHKFLKNYNISTDVELYVKHTADLFREASSFTKEIKLEVISRCITFPFCRHKFIHQFSKYENLSDISRKVATENAKTFVELNEVIHHREGYLQKDFIEHGFAYLRKYFS